MQTGKLHGRTALITGGGSGIGLAVAQRFLAEGCRVAITGRTEAKLHEAWEAMHRSPDLGWRVCDVTDAAAVKAMAAWANEFLGRVDILVNNAGLNIKQRTAQELTPESWRHLTEANLDGAFYCIHEVLPQMVARKDGVIINVSSTSGKRPTPLGGAAYSAAKAGLAALSHCLGIETKDVGVRCTVIYPGEVDTPILAHRPQPLSAEHRQRILQPEDVAEAVLFVAALPPRVSVPELIIKPTTQPYA